MAGNVAALGPAAPAVRSTSSRTRVCISGWLGQEHERPEGGVGHGVVTGVDHGGGFVVKLAVVHALASLRILGTDEETHQVGSRIGGGLPFVDDAIDELVDRRHRSSKAPAAGRRHPGGQLHGQKQAAELDVAVDPMERLDEHGHLVLRVHAEQHPQRRAQNQLRQRLAQRHGLVRARLALPVGHRIRDAREDVIAEDRQMRLLERALRNAPLPQPERAFAREQAVAHQRPERGAILLALFVVGVMVLQDVLDVVRMEDRV